MQKKPTARRQTARAKVPAEFTLPLRATLTGSTAYAFLAMAAADQQKPGEALAEMIQGHLTSWIEAAAADLRTGSALAGAIAVEAPRGRGGK